MRFRLSLWVVGAAAMIAQASIVQAQPYPVRPVRMVAPFPSGSGADVIGRIYAPKLTEALGKQFVIDNRPGASGNLAAKLVADSTPDGHTLLLLVASIVSSQPLYTDLGYDIGRDFVSVAMLAMGSYLLVTNNSLPLHSVKDLIAAAKSRPGKLTYASTGNGGALHLTMEMLRLQAGIEMLHVPYKGSSTTVPDLIGGRIDVMFGSTASLIPHVRTGRMRALGIASAKRNAAIPDVPTIAESGLPGFESSSWFALVAPARTLGVIVKTLNAQLTKVAQLPDVSTAITNQGSEVVSMSAESLRAFVQAELAKWKKVVAAAGVKAE